MSKKGKTNNKTKRIVVVLILLVIALTAYLATWKKTCIDDQCFNLRVMECKPVNYIHQTNNNLYLYSVASSLDNYLGDSCNIKISLERIAPGSENELRTLLEGKSMTCSFDKEFLKVQDVLKVENLLSYCKGDLKESVYELIIKRMYSLIIGNLDEITDKIGKELLT